MREAIAVCENNTDEELRDSTLKEKSKESFCKEEYA